MRTTQSLAEPYRDERPPHLLRMFSRERPPLPAGAVFAEYGRSFDLAAGEIARVSRCQHHPAPATAPASYDLARHRRWSGDSSRRDGNQTGERANQRFRGRFLLVRLQESTNPCASLFDVLHLDGRPVTSLSYAERRELLEGLGLAGPAWSTPAAITGHGAEAWAMSREAGLEGLIAKRLTSRYEPGARSKSWVKIKVHRLADVVIGGWVPGRGRLTGLPGAVLVGEPHDGLLHYAGSVGTGWSHTERARLAELLQNAAIDACPFAQVPPVAGARWVLPQLVGEVRYTSHTRAGRLRHPAWHRLRPDLAPDDLT